MNCGRWAAASAACSPASVAAPAAARTIYTSRAACNAATTGRAITDFDNFGPTGSGSSIISYDPDSSPDYDFNSSDVPALVQFTSTAGTFTPGAGSPPSGSMSACWRGATPR